MNRTLTWLNLLGVLALAVLCAAQWRANRTANLEITRLEKVRLEQAGELKEAKETLAGATADLEQFREQLGRVTTEARAAEGKLSAVQDQVDQLTSEREQLKHSVTNWAAAVEARDGQLREANRRIQELADELNATILKFNALATNHNAVVQRYNDLAEQVRPAQTPAK